LANTYLNTACWHKIMACLRLNKTLIHLDISMNQYFVVGKGDKKDSGSTSNEKDQKYQCMGLTNEQIRDVKDALEDNKRKYDELKKLEWKERKAQKAEDEEMRNYTTTVTQMKLEDGMKKDDKKFIENLYFNTFNEIVNHEDEDFMKKVEEFAALTKERQNAKKGGKKGKKGGAK